MLHYLYETTLTYNFTDVASKEHRLQGIVLGISIFQKVIPSCKGRWTYRNKESTFYESQICQ